MICAYTLYGIHYAYQTDICIYADFAPFFIRSSTNQSILIFLSCSFHASNMPHTSYRRILSPYLHRLFLYQSIKYSSHTKRFFYIVRQLSVTFAGILVLFSSFLFCFSHFTKGIFPLPYLPPYPLSFSPVTMTSHFYGHGRV